MKIQENKLVVTDEKNPSKSELEAMRKELIVYKNEVKAFKLKNSKVSRIESILLYLDLNKHLKKVDEVISDIKDEIKIA